MTVFKYSDELIRETVPNIQIAVQGERMWSQKLVPFLQEAENFIDFRISPLQIIVDAGLVESAMSLVIWRAWNKALPSMDLVVTPNGLAIVSNQNLAPASKERVTAAINSAGDQADSAACSLIRLLIRNDKWRNSTPAKRFLSLFPDVSIISHFFSLPEATCRPFGFYLKNDFRIRTAEKILAENLLSFEVLELLRETAIQSDIDTDKPSEEDMEILNEVRMAVALYLTDPQDKISVRRQMSLIHVLLENSRSAIHHSWVSSIQYKAITSKPFCNEKDSGGYFF